MKIDLTHLLLAAALILLPTACSRKPDEPAKPRPPPLPTVPAAMQLGQQLYEANCAACHGAEGKGDGPAAVYLNPKPRNFSKGLYKVRTTTGSLATDEELLATITHGMPGTAMPSFVYIPEPERRNLVQFVKYLTAYTDDDGKRVNRYDEAAAENEVAKPIVIPAEPATSPQTIEEGKKLYAKMQCTQCHGPLGHGDGPSARQLKDDEGRPIGVRDFTTGRYVGGSSNRDLYLRFTTGLAGTPMPAFVGNVMSDRERWSLVHYIQSLRRSDIVAVTPPPEGKIHFQRAKGLLPLEPTCPDWKDAAIVQIPLNPLWPCAEAPRSLRISGVYDDRNIAILVEWDDGALNGAGVRVQDFQDAAAMEFSLSGRTPFLGMGDPVNPVNIWQWKAGWQQEIEGGRPDVEKQYPALYVDVYPRTEAIFRTATATGNPISQTLHNSPVEDANAHGFGTFKTQPLDGQNVRGRGLWMDGKWRVVFLRTIESASADDVKFAPNKPIPVAFAVWDGQHHDRNGQKSISTWYQIVLEPQQQ